MQIKLLCNRLIDFQKRKINALRPYFSYHEIERQLNILRHKVSGFLQYINKHKSVENYHLFDRHRKISISDNRYIVHTVELETHVLLAELHQNINLNVFEQTIRQRVKEAKIRK